MPTYIVRWPNLSAALVRADDEDELIDILDEVANPDGCVWTEYDGPFFFDFELSARIEVDEPEDDEARNGDPRPLDPESIRIEGADALATHQAPLMTVSTAGDTGYEMEEAIARFAFPAMSAVYWGNGDGIDPAALEQALKDDAMRLVEYTWRRGHVHRSNDPDAQLAVEMDASLRWIKQQRRRAEAQDDADGNEDDDDEDDDEDVEISTEEEIGLLLEYAWQEWEEKQDPNAVRTALKELAELLDKAERADGQE